jgi:hypothetical protein
VTRLGVVMATYQGGRWLPGQLASIAAQHRRPDVLVVSDDGSTDDTVDIVRRFAAEAPFEVRLRAGPGTGLADNFWAAAADAGDCDLVAWADQDDIWHPAKLVACEAALLRTGALLVSHSARVVDHALRPIGRRRYPDHRRDAVRGALEGDPWAVPSGFASVFRRALLDDAAWGRRPPSHQTGRPMNHDHVVSLRAFATGPRVELAAPLARYRQHGGNAAGDPSIRGTAALRAAMSVGGPQFGRLAEVADAYGGYLVGLDGVDPAAPAYFLTLAQRCRRRAAVYGVGGRAGRLRSLTGAAGRRVYRRRDAGGFGSLALAKDLTAITLGGGR